MLGSRKRRAVLATIAVLVLVALASLAGTASATGGHLPGFSVADRKVAISKLPLPLRLSLGGPIGGKDFGHRPRVHGPVWFGEVERPNSTVDVAGNRHWVCDSEESAREAGGGSGSCTSPAYARERGLFDVGSCGKGPPRHFRIDALVPDGVTGIEIDGAAGSVGRTVPVIENTVAFTVGRKNIFLRGVGDPAAEELERDLPLANVAKGPLALGGRGGCSSIRSSKRPRRAKPVARSRGRSGPRGGPRRRPRGSRPRSRPSPRGPRSCGRRRARCAR